MMNSLDSLEVRSHLILFPPIIFRSNYNSRCDNHTSRVTMVDPDDVPMFMQSPERLQQLRRRAVGEPELELPPHKTEQQKMEETLMFRAAFEEEAFDMKRDSLGMCITSPKTAFTSKSKSKKEWDLMVHLIQNWDSGADGLSKKEFRAKHIDRRKNWYHFFVTVNMMGAPSLWYEHPTNGKKKRVVNIEQVFDVIHTYHGKVGHQGIMTTHLSIADAYYNITRKEVNLFVKLCPICNEKQPKVKPFKGAAKPIESFRFRDRFQVCTSFCLISQPEFHFECTHLSTKTNFPHVCIFVQSNFREI
jgi:hypothetical protein